MWRRNAWALPVALAILVGASTLDGEFVGDDGRALLDNPVVNGALPANAVLTHDFWGESLDGPNAVSFRPATSLLWRAVWSLAHEQPFPFRALGLVLHAVAVFFAWRWLGALGTPLRARVIAASLLAAHAVNSETTGAIVSHADLGAAALGFAALDVLARRRGIAASCLGGLLLLFAGFMKESAVLFGILGAVTAYTSGLRGRQLTLRGLVLGLPVLLVIAAQLSYTRSADLARAEWSLGNVAHGFDRVLLGLHFLARALGLTVLPVGIAPSHGYAAMELDPGALAPLAAAGALLLAAGVVAGIVALRAHDTVMATALMLLFGPVLLVTHLVIPIITDLPERVLYPATLGAGLL
ncbi:MAG: hypothetical protein KC417_12620, partial [Myxococcales bacterium]|nr:hypothetical protein [Myxococcales bacterium]